MIGQGVDDHGHVLAGFDHFVFHVPIGDDDFIKARLFQFSRPSLPIFQWIEADSGKNQA